MNTSTPEPPIDRLPVGQLFVRLLHHLRKETFAEGQALGVRGLRFPHVLIIGNLVGIDGIRLTELASRATLSLAACSELVNELESLGYLERRPDPTDGRAKLIVPTPLGRQLLDGSQAAILRLEERWAAHCPPQAFEEACATLDHLLRTLDAS
jgi:DNA-binding MarR family transcriptional regulator